MDKIDTATSARTGHQALNRLIRELRLGYITWDAVTAALQDAGYPIQEQRTGPPQDGPRVQVFAPDCGSELFTGQVIPGEAPWQFWTRVIPDHGYIDLPPYYRIENL